MNIARAAAIFCFAATTGLCLAAPQRAWADNCDLATNAALDQAKVPYAGIHTTLAPGESISRVEMIATADKFYTLVNGEWHIRHSTVQDRIDIIEAARKKGNAEPPTCQLVKGESIAGEAVTLLTMQGKANGKPIEGRFWISEKTNLPLKSEIHLASGVVVSDEFRYDNIAPPAGVE